MIFPIVALELLDVGQADVALPQGGQGGGHVQPDRLDHDFGLDADPVLWSEGGNKIPSMDPRCAWIRISPVGHSP